MRGKNKVEIVGVLAEDPNMRYTPTGRAVTSFTVLVGRVPPDGENSNGKDPQPESFLCVAWGRNAELVNQYAMQGSPVEVEGRLDTQCYEDNSGQTRYRTEVHVTEFALLPWDRQHPPAATFGWNRCTILGNLGGTPELRITPGGRPVINFRVAVNRRWRDDEGQLQEKVEWFRVVAWDKTADTCNALTKGSPVRLAGRLQVRSFKGSDDQLRYVTELVVRDMVLLSRDNGDAPTVMMAVDVAALEVEEDGGSDELPL